MDYYYDSFRPFFLLLFSFCFACYVGAVVVGWFHSCGFAFNIVDFFYFSSFFSGRRRLHHHHHHLCCLFLWQNWKKENHLANANMHITLTPSMLRSLCTSDVCCCLFRCGSSFSFLVARRISTGFCSHRHFWHIHCLSFDLDAICCAIKGYFNYFVLRISAIKCERLTLSMNGGCWWMVDKWWMNGGWLR